jgi:predicted ATPase
MLRCIELANFKSYERATLELQPLTVIVGTNASGKSNFLEAVRLLNWLAEGIRLDDISRNYFGYDRPVRGQLQDLFRDREKPVEFVCRMTDMPDAWGQLVLRLSDYEGRLVISQEKIEHLDPPESNSSIPLYQIDSEPRTHSDEITVRYNNFARGKNKPHIPCNNQQAIFYQIESPARFSEKHKDSQKLIPSVAKAIRNTLEKIVFLDPKPSQMRSYSFRNDDELKEDGSNLSAVLLSICQTTAGMNQVLNFVKTLPEQDITGIKFITTERNDVMVQLEETFGGKSKFMDAPLLSDGTLRVLAIGAALLSADEKSTVFIEEIDNGVHPSRAKHLIDQIRSVGSKRNLTIVATTHNPALLDAIPDDELENVACCFRSETDGSSKIQRIGDLDRYPELIAQGTLGELVTSNVIDRYLRDRSTPEDRLDKYRIWLESLRSQ